MSTGAAPTAVSAGTQAADWEPGALLRLVTERFVLRSMTREDVTDRFLGWLADPEVALGLNLPRRQLTRPAAVRWVLGHDNRVQFFLGVLARPSADPAATRPAADDPGTGASPADPDGCPIGFYIVQCDLAQATADTSVVVGERAWWGRNVVLETRAALLDFLFEVLCLHKVTGRPHGRNIASIFNYQALGFRCEAVLREQLRALGGEGRLDQLVFGLLRTEWQARRAGGHR